MIDLDRAVRADLAWHGVTGAVREALIAVLDVHPHDRVPGLRINGKASRRCAECGVIPDDWCRTVTAIAKKLNVLSLDLDAPRVFFNDDPEPAEADLVLRVVDGDEIEHRNNAWYWRVIDGQRVFGDGLGPMSWPLSNMAYPATEVLPR